jgi:hypothetical protein
MDPADRSKCRKCRHYYITWDPKAPYGCRILKFKSRSDPGLVVWQSSGFACLHFLPKKDEKSKP